MLAGTNPKTIITNEISDTRKPNEKRLDELIDINDDILEEMKMMNKNLAIVGAALIKMAEKGKKAVDKAK